MTASTEETPIVTSVMSESGRGLHDTIPVAASLLLFLQGLDVDVEFFDFLPDGSNSSSWHVFSQLRMKKTTTYRQLTEENTQTKKPKSSS